MARAIGLFSRAFPYLVALAAVLGVAFPGPATAIYAAVPLLVMLMMASVGSTLAKAEVLREWRRWPRLLLILSMQGIGLPVAGILLGSFLANPADRLGLVLAAAAPVEASASVLILLAGGSEGLGIALLVGSSLLAALTAPLILGAGGLASYHVAPAGIGLWLAGVIVAPLLAGRGIASRLPAGKNPRQAASALAAAALLLLVYAVGSLRPTVGGPAQWLGLVLACAGLNAAGYAIGWYGMRVLRANPGECVAGLFTSGMREFGVAIGMAVQFFGPESAVAPALYGLTSLLSSGIILRSIWSRSRHAAVDPTGNDRPNPLRPLPVNR